MFSSIEDSCVWMFFEEPIPLPRARLDLIQNAQGTWRAVVSFEWQAPAAFTVTETPTALLLDGEARGPRTDPPKEKYFAQTWKHLEIPKDTGATVTASGTLAEINGDYGCSASPLSGQAQIMPDTTAPRARFEVGLSPGRRGDVLLPWDPVVLRLSEPVDPSALQGSLVATATVEGVSVPLLASWSPPTAGEEQIAPEAQSAGSHRMLGVGPWPESVPLHFALSAGPTDPSGHTIDTAELPSVQAVKAGAPQPSQSLDDAPPGLWGDALHLPASPECESGGCVELTTSPDYCPLPLAGLAARLQVPGGATQLHVRFRAFAGYGPNIDPLPPAAYPALHSPAETTAPVNLYAGLGAWKPLPPETLPLEEDSGWSTFTATLPALSADRVLDVDLFKGNAGLVSGCVFGLGEISRVLVDRIWVD